MLSEIVGCWLAVIVLGGYNVLLTALFLNYKVKWDKWKITIEHKEKQQDNSDQQQSQRIETLEKKNGQEQQQINAQAQEITELKKDRGELKDLVIKLQSRIINCEKRHEHSKDEAPNKGNIPTPPPPPTKNNWKTEQKPKHQQEKTPRQRHEEQLKEALEKRRKKLEGEDDN